MGQSVTWHNPQRRQLLRAKGLRSYDDFIDCREGDPVWSRSITKTYRLTCDDPETQGTLGLYLKKYVYPKRRWRFLFRRDKPSIESRNYAALRECLGPVVPDVVATGRRRRWMMLHDAFILTDELADCVQLDEYAETHWKGAPSERQRARQDSLIRITAELVRRMHAAHFYHVDLQWRNILVHFGESPKQVRAFFIDAPRGGYRYLWFRRSHGVFRDLSSLEKGARRYLTRTQRLRWFKLYAGRSRLTRNDRGLILGILGERGRYDHRRLGLLASHG
ncbi:MAG: hypothetical protein JXQ73_15575 [Phycisphaerae bacterium]|nr:hypothetical protein [Phycisphaerae bacterium]